jgi:methionine-gamma-lyase
MKQRYPVPYPIQELGTTMQHYNPEQAISDAKREFGEHGGVTPSISRSSTFTVMDPSSMPEIFAGQKSPEKDGCYLYSRHFNPTNAILARYLAAMEGTEFAQTTASGMAAISCTLLQLCRNGDHLVASNTIYGGTHALIDKVLPEMGIRSTFVDPTDMDAFANAVTSDTKVIYVETMANPTLKIADLPKIADLAHDNGAKLVVDNTFTPILVSPAQLGADVVIHSLTKFVSGASDMVAGAVCADKEFIYALQDLHTGRAMLLGPTMDPRCAFDLIQRLPHLPIRMREHSRRAMMIASHLEQMGVAVTYPGLTSHPQHGLFTQIVNQGYGFGGIITVDCITQQQADRFMKILQNDQKFGFIAVSLGFYDTLMSCSGASTSSEIQPEDQSVMGLSPGLVRISIGYTGAIAQRIEQIEKAVTAAGLTNPSTA